MLKTSELFELTDEDLLNLVQQNVVIRITPRNEEAVAASTDDDDELRRTAMNVVSVGQLLELQYSHETGQAVVTMFQGGNTPDEMRWDCDDFKAEFTWVHTSSGEN